MVNFNPIDYDYIVSWQSDLENTKESILPVCDKPYHKIKENMPLGEELEKWWNYPFFVQFKIRKKIVTFLYFKSYCAKIQTKWPILLKIVVYMHLIQVIRSEGKKYLFFSTITFNEVDKSCNVNRKSYEGTYDVVDGVPRWEGYVDYQYGTNLAS